MTRREQLNSLVEQLVSENSFEHSQEAVTLTISDGQYSTLIADIPIEFLEKFSEAIVKDCLGVMDEHMYNTCVLLSYPGKSSAIWDAKNAISRKYGIK
jgi:hypothetical protein